MSFDIGSAIGGAITGFSMGGPWGAVAGFFVGGFAGGDAKRSARNKARSAFNDAQKDRDVMVQSATAAHKIVYGRAKVSGPIAYAQSTGAKGEFMHLVVAVAGHECDAIETVYFNDVALTLDGSGNVTNAEFTRLTLDTTNNAGVLGAGATTVVVLPGTMTRVLGVTSTTVNDHDRTTATLAYTVSGSTVTITLGTVAAGKPYLINYEYSTSSTPLVQIKAYLGTSTQTADAGLISASAGKWTTDHRLRGLAYLYVRMEYDQDLFGAIGLPNVSAVVRGRKVRDSRTGTTAWSANTALCAADYLINYMGAAAGEIIDAELSAEANCCDELVTIATGVTEARYTCNGALSTEATPRENLDAIVESMAGTVVWAQGRYVVRAGRHLAAEYTITEDWLADGPISIQPENNRADQINRVVAKYVEPAKAYTTIEAPPVTNATYVTNDGGLDLPLDLTLDMVTGAMRAQRLAKITLERARQGMRVQINCNLRAYDVAPGNTVALTLARYGWTAKLFTVTERSHDFSTQTVRLDLRETASAVWDWAFGVATAVDLTPNTSLPNPFAKPPALAGLGAVSGTTYLQRLIDGTVQTRALVSWTQSTDIYVVKGGRIEVRWARADTGVWVQGQPVPGDSTSSLIGPLEEGYSHVIGVRAVSQVGKQGPWSYVVHTAAGKSAAPANVGGYLATVVQGGVSILWEASTEIDYAYTELRRGATWATATALDGSAIATKPTRVTGSYYHWAWPTAGSYTLWAAHVDTSGNVSASPVSFAVTVGTNGLVQTVGLAANVATDVALLTGSAGSVSDSVADGTTVSTTIFSGSYTNATASVLTVQFSGQVKKINTSAPGALGACAVGLVVNKNGSSFDTGVFAETTGTAFVNYDGVWDWNYVINPGDVLDYSLVGSARKDGGAVTMTTSWGTSTLRVEAVKR